MKPSGSNFGQRPSPVKAARRMSTLKYINLSGFGHPAASAHSSYVQCLPSCHFLGSSLSSLPIIFVVLIRNASVLLEIFALIELNESPNPGVAFCTAVWRPRLGPVRSAIQHVVAVADVRYAGRRFGRSGAIRILGSGAGVLSRVQLYTVLLHALQP